MRKLFSILSILTIVSPVFADDVPYPETADPGVTTPAAPAAEYEPKWALVQSASTDHNAATAGYVKGAYNAALKAVNKVSEMLATVPVNSEENASSSATVRADIWIE